MCNSLYYLTNGQSKTSKDNTNIPSGDSVIASIISINNFKYWEVSGLTGTGGFSSATNTIDVAKASTQVKPKHSATAIYIVLAFVLALIVILGATYKLWIGAVRRIFKHNSNTPQQPPIQPPNNLPSNDNTPPPLGGNEGSNNIITPSQS
jgi:hypothetical protein